MINIAIKPEFFKCNKQKPVVSINYCSAMQALCFWKELQNTITFVLKIIKYIWATAEKFVLMYLINYKKFNIYTSPLADLYLLWVFSQYLVWLLFVVNSAEFFSSPVPSEKQISVFSLTAFYILEGY